MTDARRPDRPEPDRSTPPEPGAPDTVLPERLRRRLDAVFGDVLPDVTRDEAPEPDPAGPTEPPEPGGSGAAGGRADDAGSARQDAWLRANRPPHHDRD